MDPRHGLPTLVLCPSCLLCLEQPQLHFHLFLSYPACLLEFSMYSYDSSLGGVSIVCPVSNTARQIQGLQHRPVSTTANSWNDLSCACQPPQASRQGTGTLYCLHRAGLRAYVRQEHRSKRLCERRTQEPHSSNTENPAPRQISLLQLLSFVTTPGDVEG